MYCLKCGNKLVESAKFCGKCGTAIIENVKPAKEEDSLVSTAKISDSNGTYLPKLIYLKSKRRLYFGYTLLFASCLIFFVQRNYIANLISGPRLMNGSFLETELLSGNIKDINVDLQLTPDAVYPAGYTHITKTVNESTNRVESETTDSEYYLTIISKHILVIEGVPNQLPSGHFAGVITPLSDDLQSKLIADFNKDSQLSNLTNSILPYILSNKGMTGLPEFWGFLFGVILFCWGTILVFKRIMDLEDKHHYLYKLAPSLGYKSINDLSEDFVLSQKEGVVKIGSSYQLSNKFLFYEGYFSLLVFPLSQMYWAYKKITDTYVSFIPTGKDYCLVLNFKPNKKIEIKESESNINEHLVLFATLCPEAKFGYSK